MNDGHGLTKPCPSCRCHGFTGPGLPDKGGSVEDDAAFEDDGVPGPPFDAIYRYYVLLGTAVAHMRRISLLLIANAARYRNT